MDRIVVGVDPSAAGRSAMRWALREAVARGVPLEAVHAWRTPSYETYYPPGRSLALVDRDAAAQAQLAADEELKLAVELVPGAESVDARATAVPGPAAQVLVEACLDASTVVVGTRAAGPLSRALLGSVTASVLHHARCPVVVVPDDADRLAARTVRRVLVGVDHSEASLAALAVAVQQARRSGAVLVPVCVYDPVWKMPEDGGDPVGLKGNERLNLLAAAAAAGAGDLHVEPEVLTGQAAAELLRLAGPDDLLVVGSRGRGGFAGLLLGSTSTQCSQHAVGPVMVVRSSPAPPDDHDPAMTTTTSDTAP